MLAFNAWLVLLHDARVCALVGVLVQVGIVMTLKGRQWRAERNGRRRRRHRRP